MSSSKIDLVLFGARGDLSRRKLFPALYQLDKADLLSDDTRIAAVARQELETVDFVEQMGETLKTNLGKDWDDKIWSRFKKRIEYIRIEFSEKEQFNALREWSDDSRTLIFYMATPPSMFGIICKHLDEANCIDSKSRIVLEKPIGHDLKSSKEVNDTVGEFFSESSIYRIDHYLGKETVQNLLALRFANRLIHSQWDNSCIDHIQITAAETVGIEGRWTYYDGVGQLRDMVQNHLLQLLSMVAMEPPNKVEADEIRAEKVKLLRAMTPINKDNVADQAVRGQYSAGWISGDPVVGYMEEEGAAEDSSNTETFVALKVFVDNWRWAGVPILLRTGKRMAKKTTEVAVQFKVPPLQLFQQVECEDDVCDITRIKPNTLIFQIQPNEGIFLKVGTKRPGMRFVVEDVKMDFSYSETWNKSLPEAYERLLLDTLHGDSTLFTRSDEVEAEWRIVQPVLDNVDHLKPFTYPPGEWGMSEADWLFHGVEGRWRNE